MAETVVTVEGLGKCYRIGTVKDSNPTLRDALVRHGRRAAAPPQASAAPPPAAGPS